MLEGRVCVCVRAHACVLHSMGLGWTAQWWKVAEAWEEALPLVTAFVTYQSTVTDHKEAMKYIHTCLTIATDLKLMFAPLGIAGKVADGRLHAS